MQNSVFYAASDGFWSRSNGAGSSVNYSGDCISSGVAKVEQGRMPFLALLSWNPERRTFTEQQGGSGGVDAALLSIPIRNVISFNDPRMVSNTQAIAANLDAGNGLLFRCLPQESPDGLPGGEGAFLLCSFWLVDNLAGQGRLDEAHELYESLCRRANPLGLLPEQIHPDTGEFLGNFPQAFSHVGVLASGLRLLKAQRRNAAHS
ncbi:glycoside hydrolase family 15 protein [Arthrobacter sp. MDT3-24]